MESYEYARTVLDDLVALRDAALKGLKEPSCLPQTLLALGDVCIAEGKMAVALGPNVSPAAKGKAIKAVARAATHREHLRMLDPDRPTPTFGASVFATQTGGFPVGPPTRAEPADYGQPAEFRSAFGAGARAEPADPFRTPFPFGAPPSRRPLFPPSSVPEGLPWGRTSGDE